MVPRWSELRDRIPAVNDLLDSPPLRQLSERWNRSIVAAGVRSFVQELKADLERRRVEGHFPSVTELAARAAKHVVRLQQPAIRPTINATGQLLGPEWLGRPLPEDALQQIVAFGHGYVSTPSGDSIDNGAAAALCRLTGAERALVVHSYAGAIWLSLAALAAGREVLAARADVSDVDPGCSLADLAASAGASLREVGAVNRVLAADFESAASDRSAAVFRHQSEAYCVSGEMESVELEALVALARDRDLHLVDALGSAPLVNGVADIGAAIPSAAASISAGANLVLMRGDGLIGGPSCGLMIGNRDVIRLVERQPLFAAWRADALTLAAIEATLELYDDPQRLAFGLPIHQLLATSIENLRHRAERLAPQLSQASDITSAEAVETNSQIGVVCGTAVSVPSYAVALASPDVDALDTRLRTESRPIVARREGERLLVDLRSVFPRDDRWFAKRIGGHEDPGDSSTPCHAESTQSAQGV